MKVSAQYAESHLADLILAASNGEEIEIELPEKPALLLVSKRASSAAAKQFSRKDLFGKWEGLVALPTDEEWAAADRELEVEMNGSSAG
jgi:antitoxin (DNA-binding transcriptional repressor) of toxin-antitoxin stability system